jgi:hypothetical protein
MEIHMPHTYCEGTGCSIRVVNPYLTAVYCYCSAAAVLAYPLLNAIGADVNNLLSLSWASNISMTAIGLVLVVLLSGAIAAHDRYTHPLFCCLQAAGLPGLGIALLNVMKLQ